MNDLLSSTNVISMVQVARAEVRSLIRKSKKNQSAPQIIGKCVHSTTCRGVEELLYTFPLTFRILVVQYLNVKVSGKTDETKTNSCILKLRPGSHSKQPAPPTVINEHGNEIGEHAADDHVQAAGIINVQLECAPGCFSVFVLLRENELFKASQEVEKV